MDEKMKLIKNKLYLNREMEECTLNNNEILELLSYIDDVEVMLKGTTHCYDEEEHKKLEKQRNELQEKIDEIKAWGKYNLDRYSIKQLENILKDKKV